MDTDRNLLFGVLALQADLLDPNRFAEACSAWAARKDTPLAELLLERGWLTAEERGHVDFLLQRKLIKHQGDARAGLAEATGDEVRHCLASVADAGVRQSLAELPTRSATALGSTMAHEPQGRGRCSLTRLHATGGIGQVWLARDADLERQAGQAGPLDRRGLLGAFVAVCNAVAYAHSRGVLHRDLKPANVVLGDFGEVVVLDWGLAKLLGERPDGGPPATEATGLLAVSLETDSRDQTVQGQVLGTPAYMAPEQAEGRLDLLGPATDVYGLGAVLYEILTGQPPFGGPAAEVLRRVAREEPPRPRQLVPATPPALEAVCLKALAKKPAGRYAAAGELAREVERWLGDEPVTAYREPWPMRAGRWVRRHQALVAALTASLLVVLVLGGAAAVWLGRERARQRAMAESALEQAAGQAGRGDGRVPHGRPPGPEEPLGPQQHRRAAGGAGEVGGGGGVVSQGPRRRSHALECARQPGLGPGPARQTGGGGETVSPGD